MFQIHVV